MRSTTKDGWQACPHLVGSRRPASRFGGEKRLNVAVTRARSKVIVFTSFDPSDIDLSRTRSIGMAHLKAYLEAAASASDHGGAASATTVRRQPGKIQEAIASALQDN